MNRAAIRGMAAIEIKRYQKALGLGNPDSIDEFRRLFGMSMEIVTGKFMKYKYNIPENNLMHAEWESCFAYEGMKNLGVAGRYPIFRRWRPYGANFAGNWRVRP